MRAPKSQSNLSSFEECESTGGLTNLQLNDLVQNNQKFIQVVKNYNEEAQIRINNNQTKQALTYLIQAEKILQYAASCGKNIDRSLIISILHNEACAYQRGWELTKCSNYLQALIFNLSQYLQLKEPKMLKKATQTIPMCSQLFLDKGTRLIKYFLQFSAVNSQIKNHQDAYHSSKKSLNLLKVLFKSLSQMLKSDQYPPQRTPLESKDQIQFKIKTIKSLSQINDAFDIAKLEDYLAAAQYLFHIWKRNKAMNEGETLQDVMKNCTIGNFMQIVCDSFEERKSNKQQDVYFNIGQSEDLEAKKYEMMKAESYVKTLEKVLLFSIGFFTCATQLRLFSNQKNRHSGEIKRNMQELKESQIYHLISLMIIFAYVPFQVQFVSHIVASYHKNYSPDSEIFKADFFNPKTVHETIKEIDPGSVHILLIQKKQQEEAKQKKTIELIPRKLTRIETRTPRSGSCQKNLSASIKKLHKRYKQLINTKNTDNQNHTTIKQEENKSLNYSQKKKYQSESKINRRKKSLPLTSAKRKQKTNKIKLTEYISPTKDKEDKSSQFKETFIKIQGYYDERYRQENRPTVTKLQSVKSPLKTKKTNKKLPKKSTEKKKMEKTQKMKKGTTSKDRSRSNSCTKRLKSPFYFKAQLISSEKTLNRTPKKFKKEVAPFTQYYN